MHCARVSLRLFYLCTADSMDQQLQEERPKATDCKNYMRLQRSRPPAVSNILNNQLPAESPAEHVRESTELTADRAKRRRGECLSLAALTRWGSFGCLCLCHGDPFGAAFQYERLSGRIPMSTLSTKPCTPPRNKGP